MSVLSTIFLERAPALTSTSPPPPGPNRPLPLSGLPCSAMGPARAALGQSPGHLAVLYRYSYSPSFRVGLAASGFGRAENKAGEASNVLDRNSQTHPLRPTTSSEELLQFFRAEDVFCTRSPRRQDRPGQRSFEASAAPLVQRARQPASGYAWLHGPWPHLALPSLKANELATMPTCCPTAHVLPLCTLPCVACKAKARCRCTCSSVVKWIAMDYCTLAGHGIATESS